MLKSSAVAPEPPVEVKVHAVPEEVIKDKDLDAGAILDYVIQDAKTFRDPVMRSDFVLFAKRLSMANQLKIFFRFEPWQDSYDEVDPDGNHADPRTMTEDEMTRTRLQRYAKGDRFLHRLWTVLKKADFRILPHDQLNKALEETTEMGLKVIPPDPRKYSVWIFARGDEMGYETERSFKRCFCPSTKEFAVYDRVLIVCRVEDEAKAMSDQLVAERREMVEEAYKSRRLTPESTDADQRHVQEEIDEFLKKKYDKELSRLRLKEFQRRLEMRSDKVKKLEKSIQPGFLYLKLFKDVSANDLDMMVPQTEIALSTLDILLVVVPVLVGVLTTVAKIFRGGLNFNGASNTIQSLVVCLGPLGYAAKAYMGACAKREKYRTDMTNILRLHNISNNGSVVSTILEDAHEMDDSESLLAFYTLMAAGRPLTRGEVDSLAESKLRELAQDPRLAVDFDVNDAVEKLRDFGLVKVHGDRIKDPDGVRYESVPLVEALQRVSEPMRLFPWSVPEDGEWAQCTEPENETGRTLRYRFNRRTGQSVAG